MIQVYAAILAAQMDIKLSEVAITDRNSKGVLDDFVLNLAAGGHAVKTFVSQSDIADLQGGDNCAGLEHKIRTALSHLKKMIKP